MTSGATGPRLVSMAPPANYPDLDPWRENARIRKELYEFAAENLNGSTGEIYLRALKAHTELFVNSLRQQSPRPGLMTPS
jgi:hypothetical protein